MEIFLRHLSQRLSRSYWAIRLLRLSRLEEPSQVPGMVLVQIDGLSLTQFNKALKKGHIPFLSSLMKKEKYLLHPFYSGLPSNTPAVQGELFFGVKGSVPSFSFLDRTSRKTVKMQDASYVEDFERSLKKQVQGLLAGGSAYSNIFTGGAKEAHFCWAQLGWSGILHAVNPLVFPFLVILYIDIFIRTAALLVIEFFIALFECIRGALKGKSFFEELHCVWLRVLVCVVLREFIVVGVCMDIMRGLPIIHANFFGYDEQSHSRGPASRYAHWSMEGIDDAIKRIGHVSKQSPYRDYDLWVYSDHGQEKTTPYFILHGITIEEAVGKLFGVAAGDQAVVVTAMGPLGQIYVKEELEPQEIDLYARKLVSELKIPLVLVRLQEKKVMAYTPRGVFVLPDQAAEVFGDDHPFLEDMKEDILRMCWHPNAGELTIAGWSKGQEAISFPLEYGAHAGMSVEETRGFALLPLDAPLKLEGKSYLRPMDLRQAIQRYLNKESYVPFLKQEASLKVLRIMSYNVHGCRGMDGIISVERIARVIARHHPDVIALQELDSGRLRSGGIDQAKEIASYLEMNYQFHPVFSHQEGSYGNAFLSRYPLEMIKMGTLPIGGKRKTNEPRGALLVSIEFQGISIHIINTHLSIWPSERMLQVTELMSKEWAGSKDQKLPLILCGDFNASPGSLAYRKVCERFQNSQASLEGHQSHGTWFGRYPLIQLDHVFINSFLKVNSVFVPRTSLERQASDHLPLVVDIALKD